MLKRTAAALIMFAMVSPLTLSACKKAETPPKEGAPLAKEQQQDHAKQMLRKSFEESKKSVAAKVNGENITMFILLREMNEIAPHYLSAGQQATPELNAKIRKDALDTLITVALAVQEAKKRGLTVKPEVVETEIQAIIKGMGSPEAFKTYLADNGLTETEFRAMTEQDALFEMIAAREVDGKVKVTESALRERFNKEKGQLASRNSSHRQMTFEEAKAFLHEKMKSEAGEKRMKAWEKELRKNASIEIIEPQQKKG